MTPSRRPLEVVHPLGLAALLAVLLLPAAAVAQDADPRFGPFVPFGKLQVSLDGEVLDDAESFFAERPGAYVVTASGLDHPLLLVVRTQKVERLRASKIRHDADGTVRLLKDAVSASVGPFEVADGELRAVLDLGRRLTLGKKPDLVGPQNAAALVAHDPSYAFRARQYPPEEKDLARLRQETRDVTVRVYFGSWCSTCARYLPWLMAVEEALAGSRIRFEYYGLPHAMDDPVAKQAGIDGVPTAVVSVNGRELGRRTSTGLGIPEQALAEILKSSE